MTFSNILERMKYFTYLVHCSTVFATNNKNAADPKPVMYLFLDIAMAPGQKAKKKSNSVFSPCGTVALDHPSIVVALYIGEAGAVSGPTIPE